ncbi:MAG: hypothetical protein HC770_00775 [Pseudanabaena sp. CRU_2_10]|nr:hypothetical protein [Pseudanabaena sp. CRU_2_10]
MHNKDSYSASIRCYDRSYQQLTPMNHIFSPNYRKIMIGSISCKVAPIGYLEVDEENRLCWGNVQAYNCWASNYGKTI